ncbi:MAG: transposase domain-containing protein [Myxococcales bacterium]|nr:transposase domain-containing protein [Myxococcales bacterium]
MFTLIESCAMQGIDPWVYLADVLSRIQEHPVNRIHELTPMNWRIAQEGRKLA